jgi:hypothetical protein
VDLARNKNAFFRKKNNSGMIQKNSIIQGAI